MPRKHASVIIAALLLGGAAAHAAPRVVVITADAAAADLEVTRAELEGGLLETRVLAAAELPLGGELGALEAARREAEAALEKARGAFVRTNYAEGRAIAGGFDPAGLAWGGDARVARALAQLALVAAQCGDRQGFDRAVARHPRLELDPARWSPDVRTGYERALAARENGPHGQLFVGSEPAGATVLVDGEAVGRTPLRMRIAAGEHALLILQDASAPIHRAIVVQPDRTTTMVAPLVPLADEERLGALRLAVEAGEDPGAPALTDAARRLDADAVAVVRPIRGGVRGVAGGAGVGWAAFEQRGERLAALRRVVADVGRHVRGECGLSHTPPDRAHAGRSLELSAQAGACLVRVGGGHRLAGARAWTGHSATLAGGVAHLELTLPPLDHGTVLEYFLTGETARGSLAAQAGSAAAPLRIPLDTDMPAGRPWYHKWWVWTLLGTVAAGAAVTIYLVTAPGTDARLGP